MEISSFENKRGMFNLSVLLLESNTVRGEDLLPSLKFIALQDMRAGNFSSVPNIRFLLSI